MLRKDRGNGDPAGSSASDSGGTSKVFSIPQVGTRQGIVLRKDRGNGDSAGGSADDAGGTSKAFSIPVGGSADDAGGTNGDPVGGSAGVGGTKVDNGDAAGGSTFDSGGTSKAFSVPESGTRQYKMFDRSKSKEELEQRLKSTSLDSDKLTPKTDKGAINYDEWPERKKALRKEVGDLMARDARKLMPRKELLKDTHLLTKNVCKTKVDPVNEDMINVEVAFSDSELDQEEFVELPEDFVEFCKDTGMELPDGPVAQAIMPQHGCMQSGRLWSKMFKSTLLKDKNMGQCATEPGLFYKRIDGKVVLIVVMYCDDAWLFGLKDEVIKLKARIKEDLNMTEIGLPRLHLRISLKRRRDDMGPFWESSAGRSSEENLEEHIGRSVRARHLQLEVQERRSSGVVEGCHTGREMEFLPEVEVVYEQHSQAIHNGILGFEDMTVSSMGGVRIDGMVKGCWSSHAKECDVIRQVGHEGLTVGPTLGAQFEMSETRLKGQDWTDEETSLELSRSEEIVDMKLRV